MSKFLTTLRVEKCAGDGWRVIHPLVYRSDLAQTVFVVPEGFTTDFASVPRIPLAYLLTADHAHIAAVIHDFLYVEQTVSRKMADDVFYEAMLVSGEPKWRAYAMWLAVRAAGGFVWNSHEAP